MLLVNSPTNSTQLEGGGTAPDPQILELSRIAPIFAQAAPITTVPYISTHPLHTVPLHQASQAQPYQAAHVTSLQSEDMVLTGVATGQGALLEGQIQIVISGS